jgi:hypothetical protein
MAELAPLPPSPDIETEWRREELTEKDQASFRRVLIILGVVVILICPALTWIGLSISNAGWIGLSLFGVLPLIAGLSGWVRVTNPYGIIWINENGIRIPETALLRSLYPFPALSSRVPEGDHLIRWREIDEWTVDSRWTSRWMPATHRIRTSGAQGVVRIQRAAFGSKKDELRAIRVVRTYLRIPIVTFDWTLGD